MPSVPTIKSVQEQWQIHVYTVEESAYDRLDIADVVYPNWIISHVVEGEVVTGSNGEEHQVKAGGVMVHPPFLPFFERSTLPGIHHWISIDLVGIHNVEFLRLYPIGPVVPLASPIEYRSTFNQLLRQWKDLTNPLRELVVMTEVMRLIMLLMESWRHNGQPNRSSAFMTGQDRFFSLIRYMAEHLDQKITRDLLAEQVHLSPSYFDKAFHLAYGANPMQMLRDMRLNKAKRMLETSGETLSAIATACGLTDAAYLSRQFQKAFGMTPGKYRDYIQAAKSIYIAK